MPFILLIVFLVISGGWVGGVSYVIGSTCLPFSSPKDHSLKNAVTEYPLPASSNNREYSPLTAIAAGPDGVLWFMDSASNQIGSITAQGQITEYPFNSTDNMPLFTSLAAGSDDALWFTEPAGVIGRLTLQGRETEYTPHGINPGAITAGPDGALWFMNPVGQQGPMRIGRITTQGNVTEYTLPSSGSYSEPAAITAGPDGALWFLLNQPDQIGRITTQGKIT